MRNFLTITQVANRLGVCEKTVSRMVKGGKLQPVNSKGRPRFAEEDIAPPIFPEDDVDPYGGLTLETRYGAAYYEIVKASYLVGYNRRRYAAFRLKDGTLHLRPWFSCIVDDLPNHEPVFLSVADTDVPEVRLDALPAITSVVWDLQW